MAGNWLIPLLMMALLACAEWKRLPMYELFADGARNGLRTAIQVMPNLAAMLCVISIMQASGLMDVINGFFAPVLKWAGLPEAIAPLVLIRPLSGSGALAVLEDILERFGADSRTGLIACAVMGSSETIFYTVGIYLSAAGEKKTGYAIPCAVAGAAAGVWLAGILF